MEKRGDENTKQHKNKIKISGRSHYTSPPHAVSIRVASLAVSNISVTISQTKRLLASSKNKIMKSMGLKLYTRSGGNTEHEAALTASFI